MTDDTGIALGGRALFGVCGISTSTPPVNGAWHTSQNLMGVAWPIAGVFYSFDTTWTAHAPELADFAGVPGRKLHVCWQPQMAFATVQLTDIPLGVYDAHINQMLAGMAAYPYQVTCRWGHEMNTNYTKWGAAYTGTGGGCTDPAQFIAAWRYIVTKARTQAPNVKWIFCPNDGDVGAFTAEQYYPGNSYVDILGLDAYNSYTGTWRTPFDVFQPMYDRLVVMHPTAPVWVCETGCKEDDDGDPNRKAGWAAQLLAETHFSRLQAVNYFDFTGGFDWRFQTTQPSLDGFAAAYQSIVNPTAIVDGHGVLPLSLEPPPAFSPDTLPLGGADNRPWTDTDGHARWHSSLSYYLGRILATVGAGLTGLIGECNGTGQAVFARATTLGTAAVGIVRVVLGVIDATKVAVSVRTDGANNDWWQVRMDGRQSWGTGLAAPDTVLYRAGPGQLGTTGALLFDDSLAAPTANPAAGALIYADNNALKVRTQNLGAVNLTARDWRGLYGSTQVLNDNPKLASATTQPAGGFVHLAQVILSETRTITNIAMDVAVAGSGFTAGASFAALYDIAGNQLGVTGDISTALSTTGFRNLALTAPVTGLAPQKLVIGLLLNATTLPTVRAFPAAGAWNLSGINQPFVRAGGSALTTMPATINLSGLSAAAPATFLVGLS